MMASMGFGGGAGGMNQMPVGGMGGLGGTGSLTAQLTPAQIGALAAMRASGQLNPSLPSNLSSFTTPSGLNPPSRILVLTNMVSEDELMDDNEYRDIVEDVSAELNKYGRVLSVVLPRPASVDPTSNGKGVGKVFVEFSRVDEAVKARGEVEGRQFANRVVGVEFMSEDKYNNRDF